MTECEHTEDVIAGDGKVTCIQCGERLPERDFIDKYPKSAQQVGDKPD